ncbi:DUF559 domain-containing protein [Gordonia sp. ABSL11-1]|uniref:endonuclease domain-containing protein n=1 Tax=Gordonia sp. ABSL11-1 TaxID=3053924 RepID=UPI0025738FBE|nr:DUF559 domain-containing protein [Gordonia sp. ABSL11-1]MDL9945703.1 DUF559 domain-containing protein [Gordonia sp. ABSL11-1]
MTRNSEITRKRLVKRQQAVERSGMTAEEFAGAFSHLRGGLYVERSAILPPTERIDAIALSADGQPVVGAIAALIKHGGKWHDADFEVELFRHPSGCGKPGRGSLVHRTELTESDVMILDGIAVTTPLRTAYDLGRRGPEWRALGHLDDLARATGFSVADLQEYADERDGYRGIRQLRFLIPLIDALAESPPESWVRLMMIRAELPTPDLQIEVENESGHVYARIDLGYREPKIAIEYDGEDFHSTPEQRAHDAARDEQLRRDGWIVIRINAEQLRTAPWLIIIAIENALRSRGAYF